MGNFSPKRAGWAIFCAAVLAEGTVLFFKLQTPNRAAGSRWAAPVFGGIGRGGVSRPPLFLCTRRRNKVWCDPSNKRHLQFLEFCSVRANNTVCPVPVLGLLPPFARLIFPSISKFCFSRASPKPPNPSGCSEAQQPPVLPCTLHFGDSSGALPCAVCCDGDTYLHSQRNPHFIGTSLDPGRNLEESVSIVLLWFFLFFCFFKKKKKESCPFPRTSCLFFNEVVCFHLDKRRKTKGDRG